MVDPRFFKRKKAFTLGEIAKLAGGELGSSVHADASVENVAVLSKASDTDISFVSSLKTHGAELSSSKAGFCVIKPEEASAAPAHMKLLLHKNPQMAFIAVVNAFYPEEIQPGIHPGAFVSPSAKVASGCRIEAGAVVSDDAEIGEGSLVEACAVVGSGVILGKGCRIGANASLKCCVLGNGVRIMAGARIGEDGFGYAFSPESGHVKVPQLGRVLIGDNVEIGANTTVDRGMLADTVIKKGTKIDNLVQVAHNVSVGEHVVMAAHVGVSGSCNIDDYAVLGGRVGVADHVNIGKGAQIAAASGLMRDVPAKETWMGFPAVPIKQFFRQVATLNKLSNPSAKK